MYTIICQIKIKSKKKINIESKSGLDNNWEDPFDLIGNTNTIWFYWVLTSVCLMYWELIKHRRGVTLAPDEARIK